jgi:hypothetical protein
MRQGWLNTRRVRWWLVLLVAISGSLLVLALSPASQATPTGTYFAGTSAASVTAGNSVTVTITNCTASHTSCGGDSASPLGSAKFTISGAGLVQSVPSTVTASAGQTWDVSISGDTVTLHAATPTDVLAAGDSVSVDVTPHIAGTYTVATSAGSVIDNSTYDFGKVDADPSLTVDPAAFDHFVWTKEPSGPQTAGGRGARMRLR